MIAVSGLFVAVSWGVFYYPYWLFVVLTMAVFWLPEFCLLESWPRISLLPRRSLSGAVRAHVCPASISSPNRT
jgi:hypothetical protein